MIDTFLESVRTLPQWAYALGIAALTVAAHAGLKALHCTIRRVFNGRLRLVSAVAMAVHPPLVWMTWVYGMAFSLYFLIPARLGWHGPLLITANLIAALLLLWLIVRVTRRMVAVMDRWAEDRTTAFERFLLPLLTRTAAALAPVLLLFALLPLFIASERIDTALHNLASLLLIASVAGVMIQGVNMTERLVSERYRMDVENNLVARRVHTQITVLRKLINFLIILLALASMLMIFDKVRQLGTSILASAGILGVVLGFAAQKVFGNLIAGIQIALTQPIRLDDAVVVEGEWGWVEELTLTYVVIRLWDWRRLVLPINYFIDHPFQNWTRTSNDLIGSVILYADYYLPLDELQAEAERLAQLSPRWSGKVCKVQLLEMTERNMQLRVLISARGGADTFDLRCELREGLIRYIAAHYPDALPKVRLDTGQRDTASSPTLHDTVDNASSTTDH